MTGQTGRLDRIEGVQVEFQRTVGRMALGTTTDAEMGIIRRGVTGGTGDLGRHSGFGMFGMAVGATDARMPAVAVGTAHLGFMRPAGFIDRIDLFLMTGSAQSGGRRAREIGLGRFMRRMTFETFLISHARGMGFMAVEAGHRLAVPGMTFVTAHFRMDAGEFFGLPAGAFVTGDTGRANRTQAGQISDLRRMRIMAGGTACHREVWLFAGIMTIGTGRNLAVLVVTSGTAQLLMFAAGLEQQPGRAFMTGTAEFGFDVGPELDRRRTMRRMTQTAIVLGHGLAVRFVTAHTIGQHAVLVMTIDAGLFAVRITDRIEFSFDLGMAGQTGGFDIFHRRQRLGHRGMRSVTALAIGQLEVRIGIRLMTTDASRRSAVRLRFMFVMASVAADFGLVLLALVL